MWLDSPSIKGGSAAPESGAGPIGNCVGGDDAIGCLVKQQVVGVGNGVVCCLSKGLAIVTKTIVGAIVIVVIGEVLPVVGIFLLLM